MAAGGLRRRLARLEARGAEERRRAAAVWGTDEGALRRLSLDQLRLLVACGRLDEEAGAEIVSQPENHDVAVWLHEQVLAGRPEGGTGGDG